MFIGDCYGSCNSQDYLKLGMSFEAATIQENSRRRTVIFSGKYQEAKFMGEIINFIACNRGKIKRWCERIIFIFQMCWSSIANYVTQTQFGCNKTKGNKVVMWYLCIILVYVNKVIHDASLLLFPRVKLSTIVSHFSVPFPTLWDLFQSNLILWMINFHLSLQALIHSYFQIRKFRFVLHTRVLQCMFCCLVSLNMLGSSLM